MSNNTLPADLKDHFASIKLQQSEFHAFLMDTFNNLKTKPSVSNRKVKFVSLQHPHDDCSSICGLYNGDGLFMRYDTTDPKLRHLDPRITACNMDNDIIRQMFGN